MASREVNDDESHMEIQEEIESNAPVKQNLREMREDMSGNYFMLCLVLFC